MDCYFCARPIGGSYTSHWGNYCHFECVPKTPTENALTEANATIARLTSELTEARADIERQTDLRYDQCRRKLAAMKRAKKAEAELTAANQRAAASVEAVTRANAERDALIEAIGAAQHRLNDRYLRELKNSDADLMSDWKSHVASAWGQAATIVSHSTHHATAALDRIKAEARDAALVEASLKIANTNEINKIRMEKLVLSLRVQPPQAEPAQVTAQVPEVAALVALSSAVRQRDMEAACDALDKFDAALGRALRAIAGVQP